MNIEIDKNKVSKALKRELAIKKRNLKFLKPYFTKGDYKLISKSVHQDISCSYAYNIAAKLGRPESQANAEAEAITGTKPIYDSQRSQRTQDLEQAGSRIINNSRIMARVNVKRGRDEERQALSHQLNVNPQATLKKLAPNVAADKIIKDNIKKLSKSLKNDKPKQNLSGLMANFKKTGHKINRNFKKYRNRSNQKTKSDKHKFRNRIESHIHHGPSNNGPSPKM